LSQGGYAAGDRACAFYPLWPLAIRAATPLAGGDPLVAGLVLSNGASLAAWAMFYTAVGRRWGPAAAGWALALLVSFPGALFFQFPYTESLFLLGVVGVGVGGGVVVAVDAGHRGAGPVAAGLASGWRRSRAFPAGSERRGAQRRPGVGVDPLAAVGGAAGGLGVVLGVDGGVDGEPV